MDVLMPQLGETVAEGKITTWFKSIGEQVAAGENLFEIETDKTSMEVPAIAAGRLSEIRVPAGAVAPVGAIVAILGGSASPPKAAPVAAAVMDGKPPATLEIFAEVRTPERNFGRARRANGLATPLARRRAHELGVDLDALTGSGPAGRITLRDVEAAQQARPVPAPQPLASGDALRAAYADTPLTEMPIDAMRRTIARRLVELKQTIPHFYLSVDLLCDRLIAMREEINQDAATRVSLNDLFLKAWALALRAVPEANAIWAEDRLLRLARCDIGVAVALDGGLVTPVLRGVETLTLSALAAATKDLAERARARRLKPQDLQGGASTVSNLGMFGVRDFAAIINPPQSTILALGAAARRPIEAESGSVRFASQITATLSCDHRVVDGALGARLLAALKTLVESPVRILV